MTIANNGVYPDNFHLKNDILAPKIINDILNKKEIIFFTNTYFFDLEQLRNARKKGFKIMQLNLNLDKLLERNKIRVEREKYPDVSQWLEGMVEYQREIFEAGLVDKVIDAEIPIEKIAEEILD